MPHATFCAPDLTTFCRLGDLGLEAVGQRLEPGRAVLECRVLEPDDWCRRCGCQGRPRDTVVRQLAHMPLGWRPTTLAIRVRRYQCTGCGAVWRQDTSAAAEPRAKLSRGGLRWALDGLVRQHLTIARVAEGLAVTWNTANDAVLSEGQRVLIGDPHRFDGVKVIGVDDSPARCAPSGRFPQCLAAHTQGRQVRDGDHRPDTGPGWHRALEVVRHGRGPLQTGLLPVA